MNRLDGKVAVVTGASGGIGSMIVRKFLEQGAHVAGFDLTLPSGEVKEEYENKVVNLQVDITDEESVARGVEKAIESFGDITILVNAAGTLGVSKPPHEVDRADFDHTFAVNVTGTWLCTKYVVPAMLKAGIGSIINLSSTAGLVGGSAKSTYHATKGAVRAMSRADAITYAEHNIRVNTIFPGSIATPMSEQVAADSPEGPEVYRQRMNAAIPLGRRGEPEDIAYGAIYLASDESKLVTGSELVIDGGYTAR